MDARSASSLNAAVLVAERQVGQAAAPILTVQLPRVGSGFRDAPPRLTICGLCENDVGRLGVHHSQGFADDGNISDALAVVHALEALRMRDRGGAQANQQH